MSITSLDDALKGKGGDAIRSFYEECHTPFLKFFESFSEEYRSALKKMKKELQSLEPNHNGFISQAFLEHELEQGLNAADRTTKHLMSKANATIAKVSHIVDLPELDDSDFHEQNRKAMKDINQTIEKLHTFDREQTNALKTAENDLETMQKYITRLEKMYTGPKIEITGYQKGSILKPEENANINGPVGGLQGELENAEPSPMEIMLEKLGNQEDSDVDTLAAGPNRLKKLIKKYKIRNKSINNPDGLKELKLKEYQFKKPDVEVKKFEMPWGPGKIGKLGKASEIRQALTENPLKIDEVSKVEKGIGSAGKHVDDVKNPKEIISERSKSLDLNEHPTKTKQLSSKRMKELKEKIENRTITKQEYKDYMWNKKFAKKRKAGVTEFWDMEAERIMNGEPTTRNWNQKQIQDILSGKVPKYDGKPIAGHHTYSASKYPHLSDKGEIIYPATFNEHFYGWHGGNWKNSKPGEPIKSIKDF